MGNGRKIEIYTKEWCPYCRRAKMMLRNTGLSYTELDVTDNDDKYNEMVERSGKETVPQIFVDDSLLGGYNDLMEKLTIGDLDDIIEVEQTSYKDKKWDLTVIGTGPAGMTAAVYGARKGLSVLLLARDIGGQVLETDTIDNYLPEFGIYGPDLMQNFLEHVQKYNIDTMFGEEVVDVKHREQEHTIITLSGKEINTKTIIIATGSKKRHLVVPGENKLKGKGVSYCATCDGFLYEDKTVAVVGGGNSGMEAALDMAQLKSKVYLIEFAENLSGDTVLQQKINDSEKIYIMTSYQVEKISGNDKVESIKVKNLNNGDIKDLSVEAVFIEIGLIPNTGFICKKINVNDRDEIIINNKNETSIEGIFAAGDVTDIKDKQIVIAAAEGAKAALRVNEYLS